MASKQIKVTTIGGGTGQSVMLRALKGIDCHINAVVGMADSGGSSGVLRKELNMPPPGDIRHCLLALADGGNRFSEVFEYRFAEGILRGHNLGNIFFAGLYKLSDDFSVAVKQMSDLLGVKVNVIPATFDNSNLQAVLSDGSRIRREDELDSFRKSGNKKISKVWLEPAAKINPVLARVIAESDYIIFGPGDVYTSVVQTLLVDGLAEEISNSQAKKVFFTNIMTKYGQTNLLSLAEQIKVVEKYASVGMDYVFINNNFDIPNQILKHYKKNKCNIQKYNTEDLIVGSYVPIYADFLSDKIYHIPEHDLLHNRSLIRHDPSKIRFHLEQLFF